MGRIVEFEGPLDAKIYIVGEAPGENEEIEGRPFVGASGRLLDRMLMETGLVRGECRIGNVMRTRPQGNNFKHFYVGTTPTQELAESREFLIKDIIRVNPNVVVSLGNEPLKALMGYAGISKWRGSVLWSKKTQCKVIPTFHPAGLFRQWDNTPLALFDFRKVRGESKSPDYNLGNRNLIVQPTYEDAMDWMEMCSRQSRLGFDVECDEDLHITALGFADNPFSAMSIPLTLGNGAPYWREEEEVQIWKRAKQLLENESVEYIGQNFQFDMIVTYVNPFHAKIKNVYMDTMCAHHTVYPEIAASESELTGKRRYGGGKGLGVICSIYTKQPYYKHWSHTSDDRQFWRYNAMDACVTFEAATKLEQEMKEFGVWEFYREFVNPMIHILVDMQLRGVNIDEVVRQEALVDYKHKVEVWRATLNREVGYDINANSPKQLKELFYKEMRMPPKYKKGSRLLTTDEEAITQLAQKHPSPIFDLILGIRHNQKMISTYLEKVGDDGRIRCNYILGGTETGRLSSRASVFGTGTNLQNIPHGVCRKMFVADEGKKLLSVDLSQAEARVVACLAEEQRLIGIFEGGGDIHIEVSSWVFDKNTIEVASEERDLAKRLVHASNYGIGARTFSHHAGVTEYRAKGLLSKYFEIFPGIRAWQLQVQAHLSKSRTMITPLGRKRTFFGRWGDSLFREAYAYVPQSTVGDVINKAMMSLKYLHPEVEFLLQIHDEFIIQCPVDEVERWCTRFKMAFQIPIKIKGYKLVIPIGIKVGDNWEDMKKLEV